MKRLFGLLLLVSVSASQSGSGEVPTFAAPGGSESLWPPSLWEEHVPGVDTTPTQGLLTDPDDDVGTLPAETPPNVGEPSSTAELGGRVIVEPGETGNMNGVEVTVDADSEGDVVLYEGSSSGTTTVHCTSGSSAAISGMEGGDRVMIGANATIGAAGQGGSFNLYGGNATVSVANTSPPGGANVNINTAAGRTTVPPGGMATVSS